ncbi:MAG: winged helix-turn-helix transcriptional regulator [Dehalococcoidaceae bacterium]|nr:winged helix-turn-helix transcriptional regulator [Dehalococcoidaceae bacterium]
MSYETLFSNENYNLWILLRQVDQAIHRAREKELIRRNITPEQAEALFCIKVIGKDVTPTKLSRCIIKQPHSTATLINRMSEKGLVSKVKDLPQKNMAHIQLTDKGEEAYQIIHESASITGIISKLSKAEKRQLQKILEKLRDAAFNELGLEDLPLGPPPLGKIVSSVDHL